MNTAPAPAPKSTSMPGAGTSVPDVVLLVVIPELPPVDVLVLELELELELDEVELLVELEVELEELCSWFCS